MTNLDACPDCGNIVCPSALPASLIGQEHQELECEHCGAELVRDFVPGRPVIERAWRLGTYGSWSTPPAALLRAVAPFHRREEA